MKPCHYWKSLNLYIRNYNQTSSQVFYALDFFLNFIFKFCFFLVDEYLHGSLLQILFTQLIYFDCTNKINFLDPLLLQREHWVSKNRCLRIFLALLNEQKGGLGKSLGQREYFLFYSRKERALSYRLWRYWRLTHIKAVILRWCDISSCCVMAVYTVALGPLLCQTPQGHRICACNCHWFALSEAFKIIDCLWSLRGLSLT